MHAVCRSIPINDRDARQLLKILDGVLPAPARGVAQARPDFVAMVHKLAHHVTARVSTDSRHSHRPGGGGDRGHLARLAGRRLLLLLASSRRVQVRVLLLRVCCQVRAVCGRPCTVPVAEIAPPDRTRAGSPNSILEWLAPGDSTKESFRGALSRSRQEGGGTTGQPQSPPCRKPQSAHPRRGSTGSSQSPPAPCHVPRPEFGLRALLAISLSVGSRALQLAYVARFATSPVRGLCRAMAGRVGSGPQAWAGRGAQSHGGKESVHALVDVWLAHGLATLAATPVRTASHASPSSCASPSSRACRSPI
eukprot:COSAG06_NODE_6131_length_3094_cov_1.625710_1_plen_307_part_00